MKDLRGGVLGFGRTVRVGKLNAHLISAGSTCDTKLIRWGRCPELLSGHLQVPGHSRFGLKS